MERSGSSSRSSSKSKKSPAARSRDEKRSAAHAAGKNDSKKDESKDKAVKTAEVAEEASKNTGTFNFILHSKTPQICWLQYSTDHGKAVLNNKENGYHLLAQPDRMNVQTINLSDP